MNTAPLRTTSIRVIRSEDSLNPREDGDCLGKMICFHGRYRLGDKHTYRTPHDFHDSPEFQKAQKSGLILPLYLYDHSGITMSTIPFSCPWDSGQVGFIYTTLERYTMFTGRKALNKTLKAKLLESLRQEVKTYSHYLEGEVYDLEVDGEIVCCGFYGTDWATNGLMEYVPEGVRNPDLWDIE